NKELKQLFVRLKTAERDHLRGHLNYDDFGVARNRITTALLKFMQQLRNQLAVQNPSDGGPTPTAPPLPNFGDRLPILLLYSKEDTTALTELKKHLFLLMRDEQLYFMDVQQDVPLAATDTLTYQSRLVEAAQSVLFLITPNVLTPDLFALAEAAVQSAKIIPINIEEVNLQGTPLGGAIRGLPSDGKFVSQWPNRNRAWVDVAQQLSAHFERLKSK
ncbi:MAG: hypothetical protein AAGJ82_04245, partial [Bacteroidota bacterium]